MSKSAFVAFRTILALFTFLTGFALPVAAAAEARVSETYGKLPLHFEANRGQTHEDVRFLARGSGYSLYLSAGEAVLVLARPNPDAKRDLRSTLERLSTQARGTPAVLRMSLVGAAPKPLVSGLDELPGKANYFIGKDPAKWRTNVPTYAKVQYREVYPGIDLLYYGNQRQLEYDFVVAPGADPNRIVLGFQGAEPLEIDAEGELVLHVAGGVIRQRVPVIYQEIDGVRTEIEGGYVLKGANRVGFEVAAYDASQPLVIDPTLFYSTYLGGSGQDQGRGIAVDATGAAYVTGFTFSGNFPTTPGAFQTTFGGGPSDVFVAKLNPTGSALVYSTYLGGSGEDFAFGSWVAVDAAGNAYVTGFTNSSNFPTTPGAFQTTHAGGAPTSCCGAGHDAFVTKLNALGNGLVYSTYLGGNAVDSAFAIAIDTAGNAYVTGQTVTLSPSNTFPTTPGAFQSTPSSSFGCSGFHDAFVTKLNSTGTGLVYSTYLSGNSDENGSGIAVDALGSAYVAGRTLSTNFPVTPGAFQTTTTNTGGCGGPTDAFVTRLNPLGTGLVYSTYLGGSSVEDGTGIAIDVAGNASVTGATNSSNFPVTPGAFQTAYGGGAFDAFVTKLNPTGSGPLLYSTYLGGGGDDRGQGIAVDTVGNAYVAGFTDSTNFPTMNAIQSTFAGVRDAFVTKINPTGAGVVYSTYLGGTGDDLAFGIALDALPGPNAYLTGATASTDFPTTSGAFQTTLGGGFDAFVAKIVEVLSVVIDIKPGSDPNSINLSSAGVVPVAILSSATFDATQVDPESVTLAGAAVRLIGRGSKFACSKEDVNGDGLADLVCHVETAQFMIEPGSTSAVMTGTTFGGQQIRGEDSIQIVQ